MIRKLLFLILCYVSTFCLGQTANDSLQVVPIDANGVLSERSFEDLSKKYQGEEFNYDIKTGVGWGTVLMMSLEYDFHQRC